MAHDHHSALVGPALTRLAVSATLHCLTGCAIGEVLGLVLATWWGWSDAPCIALAVVLAFFFGYALTVWPLLRAGMSLRLAVKIALAADTLSILTMEIVDNAIILAVPGAMEAGLASPLFWGTLVVALAVAFVVTVPVNRAMIARARAMPWSTLTTDLGRLAPVRDVSAHSVQDVAAKPTPAPRFRTLGAKRGRAAPT